MLSIKDLKVRVEQTAILRGVDLSVPAAKTTVIMGPNGSGKSTLASTIAGDPRYELTAGQIVLDNQDITTEDSSARALAGIFLAHQSPLAIEGLISETFLWQLEQLHHPNKRSLADFQNWLRKTVSELNLKPDLLERSLNDDFSGGERKKMEIIQMLIVQPKVIILDEIDSGLDIDALKIIAKTVKSYIASSGASSLVITHYTRLLEYLEPDQIHVMNRGKITRSGGPELIEDIEQNGY